MKHLPADHPLWKTIDRNLTTIVQTLCVTGAWTVCSYFTASNFDSSEGWMIGGGATLSGVILKVLGRGGSGTSDS